jgi:hypothetical protein
MGKTTILDDPAQSLRAREGEWELGTLAIGKTVSGTDFGDPMGAVVTTLYDLCDEDDEALPVIIAELAKHATNNEKMGAFLLFGRIKFATAGRASTSATPSAARGASPEGFS